MFQYECKQPYSTMQATRLLQLNNPSQDNYQHIKYKVLSKNYLLCSRQKSKLITKNECLTCKIKEGT